MSVNLQSAHAVRATYKLSSEIQTRAVVERYLPGDDYRLLIVREKFAAAAQRPPPSVVGDGVHSLQELVDLINKAERRDGALFDPLSVNAEARRLLAEQGMQPEIVSPVISDEFPPSGDAEETTGTGNEGMLERLAYAAYAMLYPQETSR